MKSLGNLLSRAPPIQCAPLQQPTGACALIPAELWKHVFALACVDGGKTGCALALVCRYIRVVSADARFACVRLRGTAQVIAFEKALNGDDGASARMRRLFVSLRDDGRASTAKGEIAEQGDNSNVVKRKKQSYLAQFKERRNNAKYEKIQRSAMICAQFVIVAAAPNLVHLALDVPSTYPSLYLPWRLPKLEDLEILTSHGCCHPISYPALRLPALHRLHLAGIASSDLRILSAAPYLVHFRASGINWLSEFSLIRACIMLIEPSATSAFGKPGRESCFPHTIERILFQPQSGDLLDGVDSVADHLDICADHDSRIKMLHAPPERRDSNKRKDALDALEEQFLDGCRGGAGSWSDDPSLVREPSEDKVDWEVIKDAARVVF